MQKITEYLDTVQREKLPCLGHIMRRTKYCLLQLVLKVKIEVRHPPDRRCLSWLIKTECCVVGGTTGL